MRYTVSEISHSLAQLCGTQHQSTKGADVCRPWWVTDGNEKVCPYGTYLFGDVTVPNDATFMDYVAIVYSFVPFLVVACVVVEFLFRRGTRELSILMFTVFSTLTNEFIFKNMFSMARPGALGPSPGVLTNMLGKHVGSCARTCGMPSSHATMAVGFMMLMLFDGLVRITPKNVSHQSSERASWRSFSATPLAPMPQMSNNEYLMYLSFWLVVLAPVPVMRVALYDHSVSQISAGSLLGAIYAACWFQLAMWLARRYEGCINETFFFGLFRHNYAPSSLDSASIRREEPSANFSTEMADSEHGVRN